MKVFETLDLTAKDVVVGRHSVWLPKLKIKCPFQFNGRIQKYKHESEESYSLDLLEEEVALLRWLAARSWAPPVGDWVYFKTVISEHPGAWWADPCGAYGYEMAPAESCAPGKFTFDAFKAAGVVTGTPGAWNDLNKPGNVVQGHLIDVHRSGWDRLRWTGEPEKFVRYGESWGDLIEDLREGGQFPARARSEPYQEVYGAQRWWAGERDVVTRARLLRFLPVEGETVLDIGSQLGGFLQLAMLAGVRRAIGVEVNEEYVTLSRRVLRANMMNACVRVLDAEVEAERLAAWVGALCGPPLRGPDHLLLLSMDKHFKGRERTLWRLVDLLRSRRAYLETNAVNAQNPWPLHEGVERRGGQYLGDSVDRNRRRLYVVPAK